MPSSSSRSNRSRTRSNSVGGSVSPGRHGDAHRREHVSGQVGADERGVAGRHREQDRRALLGHGPPDALGRRWPCRLQHRCCAGGQRHGQRVAQPVGVEHRPDGVQPVVGPHAEHVPAVRLPDRAQVGGPMHRQLRSSRSSRRCTASSRQRSAPAETAVDGCADARRSDQRIVPGWPGPAWPRPVGQHDLRESGSLGAEPLHEGAALGGHDRHVGVGVARHDAELGGRPATDSPAAAPRRRAARRGRRRPSRRCRASRA